MPEPDVVLELAINRNVEIGDDDLSAIAGLAKAAVPLGDTPRALAVLSDRAGFEERILSTGLWADDGGDTDAELGAALTAAGPLVPRRSAALLFTAHALQFLASDAWKKVNKKIDSRIGFVRLNDDISVELDGHVIVTTVRGEYKVRFFPNASFRARVRERLDVQRTGSGPPLVVVESSSKVNVGIAKVAAILSLLSPVLGALTFWKGDELAESIAPTPNTGGVGATLAAQWPAEILTDLDQPSKPGKFTFLWTDLRVDGAGVRTLGAFVPATRTPEVLINGPTSISLKQPHGSTVATYRAATRDLRSPLQRLQWIIDGTKAGRKATQDVRFGIPGAVDPPEETRIVRVEVTDADGLTASRERRVHFQVTPGPGHQPL